MMSVGEKPSNIQTLFESQQAFFHAGGSMPIKVRKAVLRRLLDLLKRHEAELDEAIYADFKKGSFENYASELALLYEEIKTSLKKVEKWAQPSAVPTNLANFPGRSWTQPEPYGTSLVIGAWNYPYLLTLSPVVPAIAAGNTVVIKPSELAPNTSAAMAKLINNNFDPAYLFVQEGGIPEAQELLKQPFDKIFFTGSTRVGKIIMKAAAEHLSNVTLELGGKSPCIILPDANLKVAAKRIAWGKFLNSGQTCIAPDYILIHETVKENFIQEFIAAVEGIQGKDAQKSEAYVRIINEGHYDRLIELMNSAGTIRYGGQGDKTDKYIAPTVIDDLSWDDPIMQEEIFGPLLPILTFKDLSAAISDLKAKDKPLALYIFTQSNKQAKRISTTLSYGGCTINDTIMHIANPNLPFGGVGASGMGNYHGKAGFDCFSHQKSILKKATWFEPFMKYPPYSDFKRKLLSWLLE